MTKEEAIKNREECLQYLEGIGQKASSDCVEAVRWSIKALKALRPVSRERVEQVWRGCEYCSGDVDNRLYLDSKRLYLDKNGILTDEIENIDILRLEFCPKCGKPLTDKAVNVVMERLEALGYGKDD